MIEDDNADADDRAVDDLDLKASPSHHLHAPAQALHLVIRIVFRLSYHKNRTMCAARCVYSFFTFISLLTLTLQHELQPFGVGFEFTPGYA